MSIIRTKARDKLPAKDFGLPKTRQYPEEDKAHARDAKSRASEEENKGVISPAQNAEIDAKADKKLGKSNDPKKLGAALRK